MSYTNNLDNSLSDTYEGLPNSLLTDWIVEQKQRFKKMLHQLELLGGVAVDNINLDELGDRLEDIDYHCSSLANILDLIVCDGLQDGLQDAGNSRCDNGCSEAQLGMDTVEEPTKLKRWPLLHALWFHVMMATDPESIYYSPNIGKDAWLPAPVCCMAVSATE
jgi:hypothetical protein